MVGILLFLAMAGLGMLIKYGLRRPHFWAFSGVVVIIGLPLLFLVAMFGMRP